MIHYHGTPITPETAALAAVGGGHAFISFSDARQLALAIDACQSFAVDNGAFSAWMAGTPVEDWTPYYRWVANVARNPHCDFAVIPDVIDGDEDANDELLRQWPHGLIGVPVWHMHESFDRLRRLALTWPRVAIGSSGEYATVGDAKWWNHVARVMEAICDADGYPITRLHGLRMLNPDVFSRLPFASADSTNIARNIGIDSAWRGTYQPPTKESRALLMRQRIESINAPARWTAQPIQEDLFA